MTSRSAATKLLLVVSSRTSTLIHVAHRPENVSPAAPQIPSAAGESWHLSSRCRAARTRPRGSGRPAAGGRREPAQEMVALHGHLHGHLRGQGGDPGEGQRFGRGDAGGQRRDRDGPQHRRHRSPNSRNRATGHAPPPGARRRYRSAAFTIIMLSRHRHHGTIATSMRVSNALLSTARRTQPAVT